MCFCAVIPRARLNASLSPRQVKADNNPDEDLLEDWYSLSSKRSVLLRGGEAVASDCSDGNSFGYQDGTGSEARFEWLEGSISVSPDGKTLYVADWEDAREPPIPEDSLCRGFVVGLEFASEMSWESCAAISVCCVTFMRFCAIFSSERLRHKFRENAPSHFAHPPDDT